MELLMKRNFPTFRTSLLMAMICLGLIAPPVFASGGPPVNKATKTVAVELKGDATKAAVGWERIQDGALLIDVRSAKEHEGGHIEGSLNIPHTDIDALTEAIGPELDRSIVLYCRSGRRAGRAQDQLESLGYSNVYNASGYDALEATKP
jgi:phage shock protein E